MNMGSDPSDVVTIRFTTDNVRFPHPLSFCKTLSNYSPCSLGHGFFTGELMLSISFPDRLLISLSASHIDFHLKAYVLSIQAEWRF